MEPNPHSWYYLIKPISPPQRPRPKSRKAICHLDQATQRNGTAAATTGDDEFAANKNSYREVCNLFDMSISTFHKHLENILDFFYMIAKEFIHFPLTENDKQRVASKFGKISNFPNVLGCIDGSYIYIRKPVHKIRSTYTNRHDLLSITLQGVCVSDKKFTDVFIGSPSKIHDARIFVISSISVRLPDICGQTYHLLGEAAYSMREYLLTPYRDFGNLSAKQRNYNLKHAQTRVKIENCFELLKQRFRQLFRLDFFTVLKMCKFIMACCVLHNICIELDDSFVESNEDDDEVLLDQDRERSPLNTATSDSDNRRNNALRRLGEMKRDTLANSFM
ncbi:putative nuclease HARBI1 [Sabethes cyaneus]|uniref:putative nuclease HARBI1 n=1 Tax=Sabethes cyaneus TaxID=53552 RepID=UPI00237DF3CA|nr:putative nuclease HARBI1 [Sabethes cyaneus]